MSHTSLKEYGLSLKRLVNIMEELKQGTVFVEGKNDKLALVANRVESIAVSGRLKVVCEWIAKKPDAKKVIVLTDLDRRGNELAKAAVEELQRYGITPNIEYRKIIGGILKLRHFEDFDKRYSEFMEKNY